MENNPKKGLSKLSLWLIKKIFGATHDEKVGDHLEIYYGFLEEKGPLAAKLLFLNYILLSLPEYFTFKFYRSASMFKNYVMIAFRNLAKEKAYSLINIFGLGAALSTALFGYVNYDFSQSYDKQHLNAENIYRIEGAITLNKASHGYGRVPMGLAPRAANEMPEINDYTRLSRMSGVVKFDDKVFNESVYFADYNFFDIFTFPSANGDLREFSNISKVVITNEYAVKYFGSENPLGKDLILITGEGKKYIFNVAAVVENIPMNSSINFDILLPYERYQEIREVDDSSWKVWSDAVFLYLEDNASVTEINRKLEDYLVLQHEAMPERKFERMFIKNLIGLANTSQDVSGNILMSGVPVSAVISSIVTGIMILLVACFNFLQTSISAVSKRLKEIGVRKAIGGHRKQIVAQFYVENFILCLFALIVGVIMSYWVTDYFDSMWPTMDFQFRLLENPDIFLVLAGLLVLTSLVSGLYPALYISKSNPVTALKGDKFAANKGMLKKILFTGQFSLAMMTIVITFVLHNNTSYQQTAEIGFNRDNNIILPINSSEEYELIKNTLGSNPFVENIASSKHLAGWNWQNVKMESEGNKTDVSILEGGENYFEISGFKLVEGEEIDPNIKSISQKSALVNRKLVEELEWDSPLNRTFRINDQEFVVIGVIENFLHNGFWREFEPFVFALADRESVKFSVVNYSNTTATNMNDIIKTKWKILFPEVPYSGFPVEEVFESQMSVNESIKKGAIFNAIMTLIISCMGLYALVSMSVLRRKKELGIRKVLGASTKNMAGIISGEFVVMLVISSVVGCVGGYYLVNMLLSAIFAHTAPFSYTPFIISTIMLFFIASLTISSHVYKAATSNPVESLRYE